MSDEELAEEFANNRYALGCTKSPFEVAKEAFLAGSVRLRIQKDLSAAVAQEVSLKRDGREEENRNECIVWRKIKKCLINANLKML